MAMQTGTGVSEKLVGTAGRDTIVGNGGHDNVVGDAGVATNLLIDGGFETAKIGGNSWTHFAKVGGWQSDTGVEVWGKGFNGTKATEGEKIMELDFDHKQSKVWQDVSTDAGETYTFAFDYATRPGTAASTNTIEVWWNNEKVGEVDPSSTDWSRAEFSVVGTGGKDRIEFREAAGDNDSYGGMIDNVVLSLAGNGASDVLDGGAGKDVMSGGAGDDLVIGGGGNDTMSGEAGNDKLFGASALTGAVDMTKLRVAEATTAVVTFNSETAGFQNALGMYKISADGTIRDVEILFANASLKGSGGDLVSGKSSVSVELEAGDRVGFFVVPNGYAQAGNSKLLNDASAEWKFVDANGNPGNVDAGGELKLVHVSDKGKETVVTSQYGTGVFHSVDDGSKGLNGDKMNHVAGNVDVASGTVKIGFEDLKWGGDNDFDDSIFTLTVGTTNAALMPRVATKTGDRPDADVMSGGDGNDTMFGMADDDTMDGGVGADRMWGNSGNDTIDGGVGADEVYGGKGDDTLAGGEGDDVVKGDTGDDLLVGDAGNDAMNGGSGNDTADFSAAGNSMNIDLSKGTASGMGSDTLKSVENVVGSSSDDVVKGSKAANAIIGGEGNDTVRGLQGADTLVGGMGDDTFTFQKADVMKDGVHQGVDTIVDFEIGDTLDLSHLFKGLGKGTSIDDMLAVKDDGANTHVFARMEGSMVQVAVLENFSGHSSAEMVKDGMILV